MRSETRSRKEHLRVFASACAANRKKATLRRAKVPRRRATVRQLGNNTPARQTRWRSPMDKFQNEWNSVTDQTLKRMLGHKAIAAGVAGPEVADDIVGQIG